MQLAGKVLAGTHTSKAVHVVCSCTRQSKAVHAGVPDKASMGLSQHVHTDLGWCGWWGHLVCVHGCLLHGGLAVLQPGAGERAIGQGGQESGYIQWAGEQLEWCSHLLVAVPLQLLLDSYWIEGGWRVDGVQNPDNIQCSMQQAVHYSHNAVGVSATSNKVHGRLYRCCILVSKLLLRRVIRGDRQE
jgi:hypothetical protein